MFVHHVSVATNTAYTKLKIPFFFTPKVYLIPVSTGISIVHITAEHYCQSNLSTGNVTPPTKKKKSLKVVRDS